MYVHMQNMIMEVESDVKACCILCGSMICGDFAENWRHQVLRSQHHQRKGVSEFVFA